MSGAAKRRYKAICFDMGDTLTSVAPSYGALYHRIFRHNGHDLPIGAVTQAVDSAWYRVMQQDHVTRIAPTLEGSLAWQRSFESTVMAQLGIDARHHDDLFMQIVAAFDDPATYTVFGDVVPTLERVRAEGYKTAIISNWSWRLPELLAKLGFARYFDAITTSARLGVSKPNPHIFRHTLRELNIAPQDALHIGDAVYADIEGAWAVGMAALWLDRPRLVDPHNPIDPETDIRRSVRPEVTRITIRSLNDIWPFVEQGAPVP